MILPLASFTPIDVQVGETSYAGFEREVSEKCVILDSVTYLLAKCVTYTEQQVSSLSEVSLVVPNIDDPIISLAARCTSGTKDSIFLYPKAEDPGLKARVF